MFYPQPCDEKKPRGGGDGKKPRASLQACDYEVFKTSNIEPGLRLTIDESDGNVYMFMRDGNLLVYDKGGRYLWEWEYGEESYGIFAANGVIYISTTSSELYMFVKEGYFLGTYDHSEHTSGYCIDLDGIATSSDTATLFCVTENDGRSTLTEFTANRGVVTFVSAWELDSRYIGDRHDRIAAYHDPDAPRLAMLRSECIQTVVRVDVNDKRRISEFGRRDLETRGYGICVDSSENVFVSDEDEIKIFDSDDEYVCKLSLPDRVFNLHVGVDGILWVTSWETDEVWLLKY